ncbi:MAG: uroporphyrinogen decarboxylase family protein [Chloroflexi bacterium]|nr:uroporphyrinogen decarboxylase family protein [Chloroflexota bacterium]
MAQMTPRERVLAFLRREEPDRIPWIENDIEEELQVKVMGRADFDPGDLCRELGMDGFGYHFPKGVGAAAGQSLQSTDSFAASYYYPNKITFDFVPPWIADMGTDESTGRAYIKRGLLDSREAMELFDKFLPDPDHPARYERVARWLKEYKQEFAVFARIRLGAASTLESMGLDAFGYMLYDDPDLVHEIHGRFSAWSARVVRHLNELDFDFLWANDDLAGNNGPFMSPKVFREFFLPHMRSVAQEIKKPWIFHSDGNLFPLLPDLLTLGMNAVHPIQPVAMDIGRMKREYGDRVALAGNIDLDYTLTLGTPEEVDAEVKGRIAAAGPGGGYMVTSANSLTDYCKVENVRAMAAAVRKYGRYPLRLD